VEAATRATTRQHAAHFLERTTPKVGRSAERMVLVNGVSLTPPEARAIVKY